MTSRTKLRAVSTVVALGDLVTSRAGKTPDRGNPAFWGGTHPWITAKDLKTLRLRSSKEHITDAAVQQGAPMAMPGDILVLVRGMTLLKDVPVGLVERSLSYNQDVRCLRPVAGVSGEYLAFVLAAARDRLLSAVTQAGHGTGRLDGDQLLATMLPIPPHETQKWVVERMRPLETRIETLQSLIEAKRALKQGLMQELLTGRLRFPGFGSRAPSADGPPGDWRVSTLGEIADIRVSGVDKHIRNGERPVRLCNYMDVWTQPFITNDRPFARGTATAAEVERFGLRANDVLLTKDSETREEIAEPSVVLSAGADLVLGYHSALLRSDAAEIDGAFLAAQLRLPRFRQHFVRAAQGATRFGLTLDALSNAPVWMPTRAEQQRVAAVDIALHREIGLLEEMKHALTTQKRALMRRLLSGELTVPVGLAREREHAHA